jgi:hypothetical protein
MSVGYMIQTGTAQTQAMSRDEIERVIESIESRDRFELRFKAGSAHKLSCIQSFHNMGEVVIRSEDAISLMDAYILRQQVNKTWRLEAGPEWNKAIFGSCLIEAIEYVRIVPL